MADFTTPGTDFGGANQAPPNAFDDEAALLLTDVDPAFSQAPDTYDLRKFNGTIRLINGKAYPNTDPIVSAPGHNVLLRYANAGVVSHSMGVLGQRPSVVGIGAHPSTGQGLLKTTLRGGRPPLSLEERRRRARDRKRRWLATKKAQPVVVSVAAP